MMKGVITKSTGVWYDVMSDNGQMYQCRLRGLFRLKGSKNTNPAVVGDRVEFALEKDNTGYISHIEKRKNYIDRKSTKLSKLNHLIVTNIDIAFLVITLKEPRTSLGFVDRFLVAAESFRIPVCLIFNKIDLYDEEDLLMVDACRYLYENIGYQTLKTSTLTGEGIDTLKGMMKEKISFFSGHSGVGKSALVNAVQPSLQLKVGDISKTHLKGKHTTTFVQMFPLQEGGFIVDSPGIKEFGLIQYTKEEIRDYFPEIRKYNNQCRFNNCLHFHEPNCKVKEAVENNEISESRYYNYLAILHGDDMKIEDWQLR